jgi:hypothetical protein|nr:hypothetical protein [Neorhizobium tomejilense]
MTDHTPTLLFYGKLASAILLLPVMPLSAAPAAADDTRPALETFLQFCLAHGPRHEQLVAASKSNGWRPLSADMAMAFTPVSEPTAIEAWLLEGREDHSFEALVTFKAQVGGKLVEGCTSAVSGVDAPATEKLIVTRVQASAAGEEGGADTVYKRFSARIDGRDNAITISLPRYPKGSDQVVVSVVALVAVDN